MKNDISYLISGKATGHVDWNAGIFIPIDKPFDWTSFDVVNKVRYQLKRITGRKKIKVGHAGTLDPRATGLLILACGRATKSIETIVSDEKVYSGVIELGATTPTFDAEMEVDARYPIEHISDDLIQSAINHFTGQIEQTPPIYSALKKNGKRLYQYARKGQEVEIASRTVQIGELKLKRQKDDQLVFECRCSKGTYIRSLANDIGKFLNSGAYLLELKRTYIGNYSLNDAWNLNELIEELTQQNARPHVD